MVCVPTVVNRNGPRTSHNDTMIREKAQLARAEFSDQDMEPQLGLIKEDGPELIGTGNQTRSCDSSVNSSTSLSNDPSTLEKVRVSFKCSCTCSMD